MRRARTRAPSFFIPWPRAGLAPSATGWGVGDWFLFRVCVPSYSHVPPGILQARRRRRVTGRQ
eukprot:11217127-Lingulodinium_polyedra.AAC.1